ncbi:glucosamine-6-phosphate deaminase [Cyanobium sp. CH-040]|uniref:glucosamine-6-phosphate deaminase n=1 Tax=Cyanobium sp. CH-040 TaxID=2823708 RepID=UPI0020CD43E5|nr:glucosamine-6-phosphate deaminase [Cyanobium sp. CH-040]MCP9928951.1 glucosamine-6-phosphate deaminase [Cyanobium sp. CH-040]
MTVAPQRFPLTVLDDAQTVARHVARRVVADRLALTPRPLGLATGATMVPVYEALVAEAWKLPASQRQRLQQKWRSYNLDEYLGVPPHHPGSFAFFMHDRLAGPLQLDPATVRLPDGMAADPLGEARRYSAEIHAAGGIGLQLLGLGLNGHVGFNEPPCAATASCRPVELSPETRRHNASAFGGDPAAVPSQAITLGLAEILAARRILLVVTGAAKAGVLRRMLQAEPCPQLPASWLQRHPAVQVIADRAALGATGA